MWGSSSVPSVSDLPPEMREAIDTARAIITATAEGMARGDYRVADRLVQQIEAELASLDDHAAAADRAGNIIHACARLAVFVAQLPSLIFDELERDGVQGAGGRPGALR